MFVSTNSLYCVNFIFGFFILVDVENLSQKLNAKIGGINGVINVKAAVRQSFDMDRFMFFGVDVMIKIYALIKKYISLLLFF